MRRKLLPLGTMMLVVSHGASGREAPTPFEIKPEKTIVDIDQDFSVSITLRNTSKDNEQLNITSCFSSHSPLWSSDNPVVHIEQVSCPRKENFVLRLKPDATYHETVSVRVSLRAGADGTKPLKETFRMGFFPSDIPMQNVGVWSNTITIVVHGARQ